MGKEPAAAAEREREALARFLAGTAERVLVVGAHPDDEILGCGARLSHLPNAYLVCVTDGAPRNLEDARKLGFSTAAEYATARLKEWNAAVRLAGVAEARSRQLRFADQGTTERLGDVCEAVGKVIRDLSPTIVVTHPYEGGHPDHDSTAFAVHHACRRSGGPVVLEFSSYHDGNGAMVTGRFLSVAGFPEKRVVLSPAEKKHRTKLLACFTSQAEMLGNFSRDEEAFRVAPRYDFAKPPHVGMLYYERMPWGMSGSEWRDKVRAVLGG